MKKFLIILVSVVSSLGLFAQNSSLPTVLEIVSVDNNGEVTEIVNIPRDGVNIYYLHVGTMGIGNSIISINIDPVDHLFVPLGNNLTDAIAMMEELKALYKEPKGTTIEIEASFGPFFPSETLQMINVSRYQPLLTNFLAFTLEKDGVSRVAHVRKGDFNSLLSGIKLHGKIHPNEM